jgi:hypothetical protein
MVLMSDAGRALLSLTGSSLNWHDALTGHSTQDQVEKKHGPSSSAADVPRGPEFLLSRNRLNVAVSRAHWAAFVVHSPALADLVLTSPQALIRLGT